MRKLFFGIRVNISQKCFLKSFTTPILKIKIFRVHAYIWG